MRLSELVVWYLEQIESEITATEQLEYETLVVEKIIKRLLKTVSIWIISSKKGLLIQTFFFLG